MDEEWSRSHGWSLKWPDRLGTLCNIPTIFCHQVYLCGSLPAYWAGHNVILGESASIDAWECWGETRFLNTALEERTGSQNCSYTGVCLCVFKIVHVDGCVYVSFRSIEVQFQSQVGSPWISGNADTTVCREGRAFRGKWNTKYDKLWLSGCHKV